MIKILIFSLFIMHTSASVDEQIQRWEEVYSSFHNRGANWKITYVPELINRIRYMGDYVAKAIEDSPNRLGQVRAVLTEAEERDTDKSLTFLYAMRSFDALAKICDTTLLLETYSEELPESYFEKRFKRNDQKYSFLVNSDIYFLCVPKASLKIERFVEGYLRERPVQFVAFANKELEVGSHGDFYKTVHDLYYHDQQHAYFFIAIGGRYFETFWPGYEVIKNIRKGLNTWTKNIVDPFLITYFHEIYTDAYKYYRSPDSGRVPKTISGFDSDIKVFNTLIENMELANRRFDLRINLDAINWNKKDSLIRSKHIASFFGIPCNKTTSCRLKGASKLLVEDYLDIISESSSIKFDDILEFFDKTPHGETSHEIECTVVIHDIADPLAAGVDITAMSKTYSYDIDGPGHIAPHYFQDVQYLLKHARYLGERSVYRSVTIFNYPQVRDLAIQMRADAVQILKDQFKSLHLPSQLGRSLRNEQRLLSRHTNKGDKADTPKKTRIRNVCPKPSSKSKLSA